MTPASNLATAAIRIKVPHEVAVVLAIIGFVLVSLFLLALFFNQFGKKGAIGLGIVLALGGVFFLVDRINYWREQAAWRTSRTEELQRNVYLLQSTLEDHTPTTASLREACSWPGASRTQDDILFASGASAPSIDATLFGGYRLCLLYTSRCV